MLTHDSDNCLIQNGAAEPHDNDDDDDDDNVIPRNNNPGVEIHEIVGDENLNEDMAQDNQADENGQLDPEEGCTCKNWK